MPVDRGLPVASGAGAGSDSSVPRAGDTFLVTEDDRTARQIAEKREAVERNAQLAKARKRISLEDFTRALEEGKVDSLNLIIKGDVSGAVEALEESLLKIEVDDSVQLRIIHRGVGADHRVGRQPRDDRQRDRHRVQRAPRHRRRASAPLARASTCASTRSSTPRSTTSRTRSRACSSPSSKRSSRVSPRSARCSAPRSSATSPVSSCARGTITRNAKARVIRDGVVVGDNLAIESLRRFKDDVTEVRTDFEAGIGLGKFNDIQIGDEIETIELKEKPRG